VPGSGSCSLIAGGYCWIVYGAQYSFPPSAEKYAPDAFTMSQQISYEPGFSAGVTLSTVAVPPGATVAPIPTFAPVASGVPVPFVSPEGNTCEPSAYPVHVLVPVLVTVTAIRPDWSAIGTVSKLDATL
jgi:hypothetical protein